MDKLSDEDVYMAQCPSCGVLLYFDEFVDDNSVWRCHGCGHFVKFFVKFCYTKEYDLTTEEDYDSFELLEVPDEDQTD